METFTMRLPEAAIKEMDVLAKSQHLPTRTLARAWFMQRLEAEVEKAGMEKGF